MPDTSQEARAALQVADDTWHQEDDVVLGVAGAQAPDGRTLGRGADYFPGEERARATLERQVEQTQELWEKALWHLSNQRFACEPDAQAALTQQLKKRAGVWLMVQADRLIALYQADPTRTPTQGHGAGADRMADRGERAGR